MERASLIIILTTLFISIGTGLLLINGSSAISLPGVSIPGVSSNIPFGGKIESSDRCDAICGDKFQGHLIHVGNPKGGDFVDDNTTTVYREKSFSVGSWVVGLAKNQERSCGGVTTEKAIEAVIKCFFGDCNPENACADHGKGKVISKIGTSK